MLPGTWSPIQISWCIWKQRNTAKEMGWGIRPPNKAAPGPTHPSMHTNRNFHHEACSTYQRVAIMTRSLNLVKSNRAVNIGRDTQRAGPPNLVTKGQIWITTYAGLKPRAAPVKMNKQFQWSQLLHPSQRDHIALESGSITTNPVFPHICQTIQTIVNPTLISPRDTDKVPLLYSHTMTT